MSYDSPCLKMFAVPELVHLVQRYFLRQDLARCTRVCKVFLEAFTPVLWHTVSIKNLRQHQVFTTSPEIQEALSRNCAHIRIIRLQSCKSLWPFLQIDNASMQQLRVHTLEFPWPESIPHSYIVSSNGNPVPEQEQSLRSLQEGLDLESILKPAEPRDPELCTMIQGLAEAHPKDWLQGPSTFLTRQQLRGCSEGLHRYLRNKHLETEQYVLDAQNWIKMYPPGTRPDDGVSLPPPPPLLSNELQFVLRTTAYSAWTHSYDTHLRKRVMILLILQTSSLQIYQQHLDDLSPSTSQPTFRKVQLFIQADAERNQITRTPGRKCLDVQRETLRQLNLEMQYQRSNMLLEAPLQEHPLQAQRWIQLQQQLHLLLHQQIVLLYDKEQSLHVLQKLIRQQQQQQQQRHLQQLQQLHQRQQHLQHEQQQGELERLQQKQQKELQRELQEQQRLVQRKTQFLQRCQRSEWIQVLEKKQQKEMQRLLKKQGQDQQEHHEQQHQLQLEQLQQKHQRQRQWRQRYELKDQQREKKSLQELQLYHQRKLQELQESHERGTSRLQEKQLELRQRLLQLQQGCQEGSHWRLKASTELPQELMEALIEDELKKLVADFESKAQARSKSKDVCFELYTTKISQIQGWIASRKIQCQSPQLLSPPCKQEDVYSAPPSPTFDQLIPRFINSYRLSVVSAPTSVASWDQDNVDDEKLLVQFLKRLPSDSLRVFSNNKFSFRNRALLELLASSAEHLSGLSCLSMYRNDASDVNTQLITSDWGQQDPLGVDPFTAEIDWFLHSCPLQLRTLRVAIAGFLEPMHGRLAGQRNRANKDKTPLKLTTTAIQHLYLEGEIAISSQPEFLERCPDLRSLSISCTKQYPALYLAPMIEHCPKLEDLAISCPSRGGEDMTESIVAFIRGSAPSPTYPSSSLASNSSTAMRNERRGLKRLRLENLLASQDAVVKALQLCAPTLTHLAIRDCRLPMVFNSQSGTDTSGSTTSFNRILETFTQLQELDFMSTPSSIQQKPTTPRNAMLHGKFDAQHLVDIRPLARNDSSINMGWACSESLKVLRIEIHGIHRAPPPRAKLPDSHTDLFTTTPADSSFPAPALFPTVAAAAQRDLEGPDPEQIKEGHRLQWEVCLLLGTLSFLEELCLGTLNVPGDDRPPALPALSQWRGGSYRMAAGIQTQCLELALSTGLELLGGMKEMRVLKVGGLEHRIGLDEIQWMCEHWPKLEAVYGLLRVKNREQYDPDWEGREEDKDMERKMVKWIRKNRPYLRYT